MLSSFPSLTFAARLAFLALLAPACFLVDDDAKHSSPSSSTRTSATSGAADSCSESSPQIFGLDMAPSAQISTEGDYEVKGTIRYSCSGVTVQAHVFSPDGYVRWAPSPSPNDPSAPATISLRFAGSKKGDTVQYEISVFDAKGGQSWPPLRQSAALE